MSFRINHLHLKSPKPEKTADFYVKFCGAAVKSERVTPQGRRSYRLEFHGIELNVTDFLDDQELGQFYGLEHLALDAAEFDREVDKIKSAGVTILEERVLPDGRRVCFFEGPEGVRLEFLEVK